jgi:hypothetical protein
VPNEGFYLEIDPTFREKYSLTKYVKPNAEEKKCLNKLNEVFPSAKIDVKEGRYDVRIRNTQGGPTQIKIPVYEKYLKLGRVSNNVSIINLKLNILDADSEMPIENTIKLDYEFIRLKDDSFDKIKDFKDINACSVIDDTYGITSRVAKKIEDWMVDWEYNYYQREDLVHMARRYGSESNDVLITKWSVTLKDGVWEMPFNIMEEFELNITARTSNRKPVSFSIKGDNLEESQVYNILWPSLVSKTQTDDYEEVKPKVVKIH